MSAEPRPTDVLTPENFMIGMPIVEFAPTVNGVQQPFISLGVIDEAELAKDLEFITMENGAPGIRTTVLELVSKIDAQLEVKCFNLSAQILQFVLGGKTLSATSANPTAAVTNETVKTTSDPLDFLDLANRGLNSGSVVVTAAKNTDEAVGTADGTKGAVSGDFALKYKVNAVGDVTSVTAELNGVVTSYTPVAALTAGNQVVVAVGTGATSGNLQFGVGGVATNVPAGSVIKATYEPSFALTLGVAAPDDYTVDLKNGRLRVIHEALKSTGTQPIIAGQSVFVDYTYNRLAYSSFQPFTQPTFRGAARIRLLSDQGANIVWDVPLAQLQISGDSLEFDDENFMTADMTLQLLDAEGTARYGTVKHYSKTQAGN